MRIQNKLVADTAFVCAVSGFKRQTETLFIVHFNWILYTRKKDNTFAKSVAASISPVNSFFIQKIYKNVAL